jgi:hypothetical protein
VTPEEPLSAAGKALLLVALLQSWAGLLLV